MGRRRARTNPATGGAARRMNSLSAVVSGHPRLVSTTMKSRLPYRIAGKDCHSGAGVLHLPQRRSKLAIVNPRRLHIVRYVLRFTFYAPMARVIAISNLKGGIGKTTTVVNLGAGLALKGARVLLVDVDAQGNLAMALGVRPRRTLYEVLVDGAAAADCVFPARPNLDLIGADHALLGVQPIIAQRPDWSRVLEQGLRPLFGAYDFILIDSGGSLTVLNTNALMCASDVLVPTAVEHFSLKSIELLFEHVTRIKGHSGSIRMIIPTLYDPRMRQSIDLLADLRARYGALVADPVRINVRLSEAPTLGRTIYEYDPRSRGAADYAVLVERVSDTFGFQPAPRA